ncbi:hypothetical protein B0H19DRAFT_691732 [Mycena capillaripes]|nr:hypothetical protein B0H19DRAFT_691732 [Mycena capillaripes]
MMTEKDELQQDFKRILSVERGAYTALFEAKRLLEEEVRSMQTRAADAESAFVVELEQRYQAEKKLADAQARMATLEAERKSLQSEMETSRARYPAFGEFVRAQGTELGTTNAQESSERQWIQANLNDANRRVATYEGEKKAEGALAAKDSELQSQREKSDARIAGLKEKLTCVKEELAELDIENRNLRETHKQHLVEISELKTRIGRVKETFNKSKAEQDRQYDDLQSDYSELLNQYTEQTKVLAERDSALAQRDTTLAREIHKLQALTTENGKLQQTLAKLQATNKNLQSSVLRAGAEAKQELQKEANTERQNFEANIQALEKQNAELQKELNSVRIRSQELQMATDTERQSHETTMKIFQRAYETKLEAYDKLRAKLREEIRSLRTSLADAVRERDDPIESLNTVQPTWNYHHQAHSLDERAEQSDRSTRYSTRDDDDQSAEPTPEPHNLSERALYTRYMKSEFPVPANQPTLKDLEPIHRASGAQALDIFLVNNIHRQRRTLYCPKRSLWCGAPGAHVLVFAATCEYSKSGPTRMALNCGQQFDLFMNKGEMVYYVGIYEVLSLREVHPPGARIPTDVSRVAIVRGMGIHPGPEGKVNEKIRECYPDGDIRTECFGLRVIGFDHKLYENLREDLMSGDGDKKRKAGSEDLRNDGKKGKCKMQKV